MSLDDDAENIYYRQELEWWDGLGSNRTSSGQVTSPRSTPLLVYIREAAHN